MRRLLPFLLLGLVAFADGAAACAVCAAGEDDRSRDSYIIATIVMSVLPVALVGSLVWYVRRRTRMLNASEPQPAPAR
ncbi:MAG: hypothetical protein JRG95_10010 [Deltaproteobacteria bacterium]|nr:hypothetical protein [Deltaproteobacteria bacterium]